MSTSENYDPNGSTGNTPPSSGRPLGSRQPVRMPAWLFYPLVAGTIGGAFYFARRDDFVTATTIVVLAISASIGFRMGFAKILASVVALGAAIYFAPSMGLNYEDRFAEQFGTSGLMNRILCTAAIGVLISLVVHFVLIILINWMVSKRRKLQAVDRYTGFAGGLVEGALTMLLVLGAALSMQLWQREQGAPNQMPEQPKNNKVASWINEVASRTRTSAVGSVVQRFNPFERLEVFAQLKDVQSTVKTLQDPAKVDRLLRDPRLDELKSDPDFEAAVETLRQDPEIGTWLKEGAPLDREMVMRLMNHPAVLELIDQEDFLERAHDVVKDSL